MSALLVSADLLATSKLAAAAQRAGSSCQVIASAGNLAERLSATPKQLVVIDLASTRVDLAVLVAQLRAASPSHRRSLAFGPHVHEDRLKSRARRRLRPGPCRGQFHAQAEAIFGQYK